MAFISELAALEEQCNNGRLFCCEAVGQRRQFTPQITLKSVPQIYPH